jgi:hypothetical protein
MVQALWKQFSSFWKINHTVSCDPAISLGISKKTEGIRASDNLYTNAHSSVIPNSQKMEKAQIAIKW